MPYPHDLIIIGAGPAGYAAAIRAGQLKKRVLCIEAEALGGTCLNWGCIPTKALLDPAGLVLRLKNDAEQMGISVGEVKIDFAKIIARSRAIAERLSKGIDHLFRKYEVKRGTGRAQLLGPHRVKLADKELTAEHIILATGAKPRALPGVDFDGTKIISSKEAMTLPAQPKRLAIIGAGAIGCEFADFYSALGTEVTIIELLDHLLPNEDVDVSLMLERIYKKRGIAFHTRTRTGGLEKTTLSTQHSALSTGDGVRIFCSGPDCPSAIEADIALVAIGVTGNIDGLASPEAKLELYKNHVKVDRDYRTNLDHVWAVGDVIGPPWLAHVAHHEAIHCVERMFGVSDKHIDYKAIPGCTYTHPQVASMGLTEKQARDEKRNIRVGKFPFSASGRALAAGETDGFVKLIFDAAYGELLGVHMIGENVTELLAEMVLAKNLEATEDEIIDAMHPHPTFSEAIMEAAGVAVGRAIHL